MTGTAPALELRNLSVRNSATGDLLLRDVNLSVAPGEVVGLVGESGSGKSMTALALLGLLPIGIEPVSGEASIKGMQHLNGGRPTARPDLAVIFQNARAALNPIMRVGRQVERICRLRDGSNNKAVQERALSLLRQVGIPGADSVAKAYPHQLSGGMCQRVMIAMALASRPALLVADEPTTGLDVTVQAQILNLLQETVNTTSCGIVLITHDLAVVGQVCEMVAVMYGGQLMEYGPTADVFEKPRSPYAQELISSMYSEEPAGSEDVGVDFALQGCRLIHRCPLATDVCSTVPPLIRSGSSVVACHHAEEAAA